MDLGPFFTVQNRPPLLVKMDPICFQCNEEIYLTTTDLFFIYVNEFRVHFAGNPFGVQHLLCACDHWSTSNVCLTRVVVAECTTLEMQYACAVFGLRIPQSQMACEQRTRVANILILN